MTELNPNILRELRGRIDEVDSTLVRLLARRRELVGQVADIKREHGLPVYVPEREKQLLADRREEALRHGVSPDMVEDLLRRIMRESYQAEEGSGFKNVHASAGPMVVIGGGGGMGQAFCRLLRLSGYQVQVLEKDDWDRADDLFENASLVLVSVPMDFTQAVIEKLRGRLPEHCILADLTSVKKMPMEAMLAAHSGPVVGFHPMFGPSTQSLANNWWWSAMVAIRLLTSGYWTSSSSGASAFRKPFRQIMIK